jgi:hypothetical protein
MRTFVHYYLVTYTYIKRNYEPETKVVLAQLLKASSDLYTYICIRISKFKYPADTNPPLHSILSQINLAQNHIHYFPQIRPLRLRVQSTLYFFFGILSGCSQ